MRINTVDITPLRTPGHQSPIGIPYNLIGHTESLVLILLVQRLEAGQGLIGLGTLEWVGDDTVVLIPHIFADNHSDIVKLQPL
ncbi:hypothetical protein D3C75_687680 [compost metagenome]